MCFPVTCGKCGKITWDGCGEHVADVMGPVPADRRCTCPDPRSAAH
ncbi:MULTISPECIES: hypothetical protein [Gordonia]|uniref:Uncharacterized protein n=2 Tax=Gordonia TaxID=2053 RepID=L7LPD2_9ACTN|nr:MULTISPECIES: hypothetical protein [Gordonia]WFN92270.1 hypothetical protein P5P27_16050 [Gordonia sihwensis]GAC61913.1 hypothetical protein GSI01S_25_00660 [Gordonia sihwensis NBRC 108236]